MSRIKDYIVELMENDLPISDEGLSELIEKKAKEKKDVENFKKDRGCEHKTNGWRQ